MNSLDNLSTYPGHGTLKVHGTKEAVSRAKTEVAISRSTIPNTLVTRLSKLNNALLKGFKFKNIYFISGASGSGKSYLLNQIRDDFLDPQLNGSYPKPFKILSFSFEMPIEDEMLRTVSGKLQKSYSDLISANTILSDEDQIKVEDELDKLDHPDLHFVETSGNRYQIYNTIIEFHKKFPSHQLIITFDHTLLAEEYDEKTEIEMIAKLSKMFVKLKKSPIEPMIIMLGQMNDKIEDPVRIQNYNLHYPTKKDVHGSKQVFWACDYVLIIHRPEELGIAKYGPKQWDTTDLIAGHLIKSRKGKLGIMKLKAEFDKGQISQF